MALPFRRDRKPQLVHLLGELIVTKARGFHCSLSSAALLQLLIQKSALGTKIVFQPRDATCGRFELLIERRLFPVDCIQLAFRFVQLSFDCSQPSGRGGLVNARSLLSLTSVFQTFGGEIERFLGVALFRLKISARAK